MRWHRANPKKNALPLLEFSELLTEFKEAIKSLSKHQFHSFENDNVISSEKPQSDTFKIPKKTKEPITKNEISDFWKKRMADKLGIKQ